MAMAACRAGLSRLNSGIFLCGILCRGDLRRRRPRTIRVKSVVLPHFSVDFVQELRMIFEVLLRILAALSDPVAVIVVPGAALIDDIRA